MSDNLKTSNTLLSTNIKIQRYTYYVVLSILYGIMYRFTSVVYGNLAGKLY